MAAAAEILLTGRMFDGNEAKELGVCSRVLPNDEVLPAALALAHDIAANTAPLSVAFSKRVLWGSSNATAAQIEKLETDAHHHLMGCPDAREGVMAFLERRAPAWQGRVSDEWPEGWPGEIGTQ
jgi:enoyl-CoA hydratase/carnithine racemase